MKEPNPLSSFPRSSSSLTPRNHLFSSSSFLELEVPHESSFSPRNSFNLFSYLTRNIWLIVGVTVTVTTAVFSWSLTQKNQYQGKFQVLVEPLQTETTQKEISPISSATHSSISFDYESQIALLQSQKVMTPILKKIQTRYPQINYNSLLGKSTNLTQWGATPLRVKRLNQTKIIEVSYQDEDPKKIQFVLEQIAQGYLKYSIPPQSINRTLPLIQSQIPGLQKKSNTLQNQIQKLQQQYNFVDPQTQSKQVMEQTKELQAKQLENTSQLLQQKSLYDSLQAQLGLNPQEALMSTTLNQSPRYKSLLTQLQQVEVKLAIDGATYTNESPQIQNLQDQYYNLSVLLNEEAERILGKKLAKVNPNILSYQDSIRLGLTQQLINVANEIQVLELRQRALNKAAQNLKKYTQELPPIIRRYNQLQQQLKTTHDQLNTLGQKKQALQLEEVGKQKASWELIAQPEIPRYNDQTFIPVYPNIPLNIALGTLGGFLLGIGTAVLGSKLQNRKVFLSPEDVKYTIRLPLLGVIPATDSFGLLPPTKIPSHFTNFPQSSPSDQESYAIEIPTNPFRESFRSFNANLRLFHIDNPINSCVITSCQVGDGKSTVALNLAMAAAAMGQRVLLVDADLRRPQIHKMLEIGNEKGLSHVITEDIEVEKLIKRSSFEKNLSILTSGAISRDPTQLLSSRKMQNLIPSLANQFDLVIYDTPPLLGLADANLLGIYTDGLMLVVGLHQTEREALLLALEDLKLAGLPLLGMVVNGDKSHRYYSQYYTDFQKS